MCRISDSFLLKLGLMITISVRCKWHFTCDTHIHSCATVRAKRDKSKKNCIRFCCCCCFVFHLFSTRLFASIRIRFVPFYAIVLSLDNQRSEHSAFAAHSRQPVSPFVCSIAVSNLILFHFCFCPSCLALRNERECLAPSPFRAFESERNFSLNRLHRSNENNNNSSSGGNNNNNNESNSASVATPTIIIITVIMRTKEININTIRLCLRQRKPSVGRCSALRACMSLYTDVCLVSLCYISLCYLSLSLLS